MIPFTEVLIKLRDPLSHVVTVDDTEIMNDASYHAALHGIKSEPKKRRGRDDAQIEQDVARGKACEVGVRKLIPRAHVYDSEWKLSDRHSYGKDVVTEDGLRLEVKSSRYHHRFGLAPKSYNTILENIKEGTMDAIVVAFPEYDPTSYRWKITPEMIIDPSTYGMLCDIETGFTTMHIYRDSIAAKRGYVAYVNRKDEE